MTSKNWSGKFARVCTISLLIGHAVCAQEPAQLPAPPAPAAKTPAIALVDPADAAQWQTWAKSLGWLVLAPPTGNTAVDARVEALAAAVRDAIQKGAADPTRIYVAGRAEWAALVFYTISRVPDLWAAGLALGGSPQPAVDSDRLFTANFTNVPVLWVSAGKDDQALAAKLKNAGLNLEWQSANGATNAAVLGWLATHQRDQFPNEIDCETNSPSFNHCYWIEITKFDPGERNDVLPSSRLKGGTSATLDLGGFGYKTTDPGPGVLVSYLPEKYSGPLKMGDRIVALDGRPIEDANYFNTLMAKATDEAHAVALVQRGKERIRLETRILVGHREPVVTARVDARYVPADKEIQIVSRTIQEMRVTIPPHWAPESRLFWNGLALDKVDASGCLMLKIEKELLHASKCE